MALPFAQAVGRLKESFWFIPSVMALLGVSLAWTAIQFDRRATIPTGGLERYMAGGPEGAVSLLSSLAGSIITVTGVVFSITILTLSLASNQFGPRLLRTFRSDRANQVVLGTFIATYAYCLVALMNVGGGESVLRLTVFGAFLLTAASIGVLIYFIHHVAVAIQAGTVVDRVAKELRGSIDRLYPDPVGRVQDRIVEPPPERPHDITAALDGYISTIDNERVLGIACRHSLVVHVLLTPGTFVVEGQTVMQVWGPMDDEVRQRLRATCHVGPRRSGDGDAAASIEQLVEVAVRALSSGVNDPYTATTCIDRLGAALCRLATRDAGPRLLARDGSGRVLSARHGFAELVETAFAPIRQNAGSSPLALQRLMAALDQIDRHTDVPARRAVLVRHARLVAAAAQEVPLEADRQGVLANSRLLAGSMA